MSCVIDSKQEYYRLKNLKTIKKKYKFIKNMRITQIQRPQFKYRVQRN